MREFSERFRRSCRASSPRRRKRNHAAGAGSRPSIVNCESENARRPASPPRVEAHFLGARLAEPLFLEGRTRLTEGRRRVERDVESALRVPCRYVFDGVGARITQGSAELLRGPVVVAARQHLAENGERRELQRVAAPRAQPRTEQRVLGAQRNGRRLAHPLPEHEAVIRGFGEHGGDAARCIEEARLVPAAEARAVRQGRITKRRGEQVVEASRGSWQSRLARLEHGLEEVLLRECRDQPVRCHLFLAFHQAEDLTR